jgi:hypothetical protein
MTRRLVLTALIGTVALSPARAVAADAIVSGPATRGAKPNAFHATVEDLKARGYLEQEFFVEGTAEGKAAPDAAVAAKPYKTRLLVRRPVDPAKFNGTVVVEWQNVTLGYDLEVGWPMFGDLMMRDGYAWVAVSNQPVGVNHLRHWDPKRYGSLAHPAIPSVMPRPSYAGFVVISGETYSDAIYTQLAAALRHPGRVDPLAGLTTQRLISYGLSQSAGRLTAYINNLPADARPYDGYYLHVGPGQLRDDLAVPVFGLNSENEMMRYAAIRRPDSAHYRYWEVAGSGHLPRLADDVLQQQNRRDGADWPRKCDFSPAVVSIEYASRAALHHLNEWIKTGVEPPVAPLVAIDPGKRPTTMHDEPVPPSIARDLFGNAVGGLRLPHIEAPLGRHIGTGTPAPSCTLTPGYEPFDPETVAKLYPTREAYLAKVDAATSQAEKAGYLLGADAKTIRDRAAATAR